MDDADEELSRLAIRQAFEAKDQYIETVPAADAQRVAQLRQLGRAVARDLGWRVRTFALPIEDGATSVVLVITRSTPLRDEVMQSRRRRGMRDAITSL